MKKRIHIASLLLFLMIFFKGLAIPEYLHMEEHKCIGQSMTMCPICDLITQQHTTFYKFVCEQTIDNPVVLSVFSDISIKQFTLKDSSANIVFFCRPPPATA